MFNNSCLLLLLILKLQLMLLLVGIFASIISSLVRQASVKFRQLTSLRKIEGNLPHHYQFDFFLDDQSPLDQSVTLTRT